MGISVFILFVMIRLRYAINLSSWLCKQRIYHVLGVQCLPCSLTNLILNLEMEG